MVLYSTVCFISNNVTHGAGGVIVQHLKRDKTQASTVIMKAIYIHFKGLHAGRNNNLLPAKLNKVSVLSNIV